MPSAWLSSCKAVLSAVSSWDPRTKGMWASRKESSRVLVKFLGAGAYAVLESGGTALFSLKMGKVKVDLITSFT